MLAQSVGLVDVLVVVAYMAVMAYLGWLGYRGTKTAADYMLAGRKTHPVVMALSYGATFISTSAIVGFGGVSGMFGMSLMWLVFLNILVGIFVSFIFLGSPTRRMGHHLDAHTFPELLGRRYQSKFIQVFTGFIIFLFMPLYAAAVLIGGCEFLCTHFEMNYEYAVLMLGAITAVYVVFGGLKGVLYTDALQGSIMLIGMIVLLVFTYISLGGVTQAHQTLTSLKDLVPGPLKDIGHRGWTAMPEFGWGDKKYNLWWTVVTTITMGVGIGVLAQPQLAVRFMTVKSRKELNRAVILGGIFILAIPGSAYVCGAMSNAYFAQHGKLLPGVVAKTMDANTRHVVLQQVEKNAQGQWAPIVRNGKPAMIPAVLDASAPYLGEKITLDGKEQPVAQGRTISLMYAGGPDKSDQIIPIFIKQAMPRWFGLVFLVILLAAAMSTLSGQYHAIGTSISHDIYGQLAQSPETVSHERRILLLRVGIIIGIIGAVTIAFKARGDYIVARATAIFFEMCLSAFLPMYVGGLFWKRMTRSGAIASMLVGFTVGCLWLLLVKEKEAGDLGLVKYLSTFWPYLQGQKSILWQYPNWPVVDALMVALPLSVTAAVVVSLMTKPPTPEHLAKCFAPGVTK